MVVYAAQGLIGSLTPQANTTVEPEFNILCPPGFGVINARLTSRKRTIKARLRDYFVQAPSALAQFANAPVAVHAFACTGASYLAGAGGERRWIDRIEASTSVPFVTAGRAARDMLDAIGAQRIALVSPYPAALMKACHRYWRDLGFDVAETVDVFTEGDSFHPIYSMEAEGAATGLERLRDAALDAVLLLGTGMPTLHAIADRAGADGPPVISCMLALVWRSVLAARGEEPNADSARTWIAGTHWAPGMSR